MKSRTAPISEVTISLVGTMKHTDKKAGFISLLLSVTEIVLEGVTIRSPGQGITVTKGLLDVALQGALYHEWCDPLWA